MTGSGTSEDPYIISDVDDLQAIEDHLDSYYELGGDIDASATSGWNSGAGFLPIGITTDPFSGQLDGNGYTISGLFIDRDTTQDIGLIGKLDGNNGGVLKNISMTGVDITGDFNVGALVGIIAGYSDPVDIDDCNSAGSITATKWAGGLLGYVESGAIDNCHSSCTVIVSEEYAGGLVGESVYEGVTITGCYATGNITGGADTGEDYFGGLVGKSFRCVYSKCYATGDITGYRYLGGLIGNSQYDTISNCYARGGAFAVGYYAGGLIGYSWNSDIDNCYSTGSATAEGGSEYAGGLIADESSGTVTNCFWDTETSENATSDGGTGKTSAQMKTEATFTDAGWDFTTPIWYIGAAFNNGYPAFEGVLIPTVTTNPASALSAIAATLNGTLADDGGEDCDCGFEWGFDTGYGVTTPTQSRVTGETFSQPIGGLFPGTTYHFRAFATNSVGTGYGADRTFTTALVISRAFALAREEL